MKIKIIISSVLILLVGHLLVGCDKESVVSIATVEGEANPVSFITIENATDSGTIAHAGPTTKAGYTAIVQRNNLKDSSAIDSVKLYYQTSNATVDSSVLTVANLADTTVETPYTHLLALYYTFNVPTTNLITGKTYTVLGTIYTHAGNMGTGTFSSLFKW
jgi:hypothetical protein